ncbi:MAG: hypothetical protein ACYDD1_06770 [Caulobacteraceae bacterium]
MRRIILLCACLTGCAAGNTGAKFSASHINVGLPSISVPPPAAVAMPRACAAELLADPLPEPAPDGGFPAVDMSAPDAAEASAQEARYLAWIRAEAVWGRAGWARAAIAKGACQ